MNYLQELLRQCNNPYIKDPSKAINTCSISPFSFHSQLTHLFTWASEYFILQIIPHVILIEDTYSPTCEIVESIQIMFILMSANSKFWYICRHRRITIKLFP